MVVTSIANDRARGRVGEEGQSERVCELQTGLLYFYIWRVCVCVHFRLVISFSAAFPAFFMSPRLRVCVCVFVHDFYMLGCMRVEIKALCSFNCCCCCCHVTVLI